MTRAGPEARYREPVPGGLSRRAHGGIVLDRAVGGRWCDALDRWRSPASTQPSDELVTTRR
ncbi:hypothetical protein ACI798_13410 [Geodermatophilus sp. SYSU D01045]